MTVRLPARQLFVVVVALAALALSVAALVVALRRGGGASEPGRAIDVGPGSQLRPGEPVHYASDDMWVVRVDADGGTRYYAFYDVVPGFFGLSKGCRVRWQPNETFEVDGKTVKGVFSDPCGGSRFVVDGTRFFGPAPRDLDQFYVVPPLTGHDDLHVDTRVLICATNTTFPGVCHRTLAK